MFLYFKATLVGLLFAFLALFAALIIVSRMMRPLVPPGAVVSVSAMYWPLPTAAIFAFVIGFWWVVK